MLKRSVAFLSIFVLYFASSSAFSQRGELTKEQIAQAAINKAKELGCKVEEMTVTYDEGNRGIEEHLKRIGVSTYNEKAKEWVKDSPTTPEKEYPELAGRNYQAVYFGYEDRGKEGDLWVFVDKSTGELIRCVRGK